MGVQQPTGVNESKAYYKRTAGDHFIRTETLESSQTAKNEKLGNQQASVCKTLESKKACENLAIPVTPSTRLRNSVDL